MSDVRVHIATNRALQLSIPGFIIHFYFSELMTTIILVLCFLLDRFRSLRLDLQEEETQIYREYMLELPDSIIQIGFYSLKLKRIIFFIVLFL